MLFSWLLLSVAVWFVARLVPGVEIRGAWGSVVVAGLFGLINTLIGWLLFVVIGVATVGLGFLLGFVTRWIVNAIVLKIVDAATDKLTIDGFGRALWASLAMSIIVGLLELATQAL